MKFWEFWPSDLRALWTQAFTAGLRNPSARPAHRQWLEALSKTYDSLCSCRNCGKTNVYDRAVVAQSQDIRCVWCGGSSPLPPRARVRDSVVILSPGSAIFEHHISAATKDPDVNEVALEVTTHPDQPGVVGLTNRTNSEFAYVFDDSTVHPLPPGKTARVVSGATIRTGGVDVQLRV